MSKVTAVPSVEGVKITKKKAATPKPSPGLNAEQLKAFFSSNDLLQNLVKELLPAAVPLATSRYQADPFQRFPMQTVGILKQTRSAIPKDLGGQVIFVLDFDSQNIASEQALSLGITKDELYRNAVWEYLDFLTKK